MESKKTILTKEGLKAYEDELQDLRVNKRPEIAQKLKAARAQGDLSENAEYDAAKDEQRDIEARIEQIESILKSAEIFDETEGKKNEINIGCFVKIQNIKADKIIECRIVGSTEADSLHGKISNESPVGSALIGAKKGDIVTVETEAGQFEYKVIEFSRSK